MTTPDEPQDSAMADVLAAIAEAEPRRLKLTNSNREEIDAIAQLGASISAGSIVRIRMDAFIEFIFERMGNTSDEVRQLLMLQFEVAFEQKLADVLKMMKGDVRQAMLGMGASVPQSEIAKVWRAQQRNGNGGPQPGPGGLIGS